MPNELKGGTSQARKIKVLVVDDNPGDVRLISEILKEYAPEEFECLNVNTLRGALKRLSREKVETILLDLFISDSYGMESLKVIRGVDKQTPIVVLTGSYDKKLAAEALETGATCFLMKDRLEGSVLVKTLRELSERKDAKEEP